MRRKIWIIIIIVNLTTNCIFSNTVIVCGKIQNYANKSIKLNILRTDAVWLDINTCTVKSKTTKDCFFQFFLEDIDHVLFENTLEIGSKKIYISIAPGDSLFINCDYLHIPESISFSGRCATKNYFINSFMPEFNERSKLALYDYNWLNNSKYRLVENFKKYNIDSISMEYIGRYLDCHFYNYLITSPFIDSNEIRAFIDTLNINDEKLNWYFLYNSVLSGYLSFIENTPIDLTTDVGFERAFAYSKKHLIGSTKENYQAYLIGYSCLFPTKEFRKSDIVRRITSDYLNNCQNEFVKKSIKNLLHKKAVI